MLDDRRLNRATLARQLLLERSSLGIVEAVEHLVGMQSQLPFTPYVGLWSRLADFEPAELGHLLTTRQVVRMVVMRSTVHLVSGADALALRPVLQPALNRQLRANRAMRLGLEGLDIPQVLGEARRLLEESPLTPAELGVALRQRWPDRRADALVAAARTGLALVQVPPRGVWGAGGKTRYAVAEGWLGAPLVSASPLERLVLRYLAAFGPASTADVQTWSGLTRLGEVVQRLRPNLQRFRRPDGTEVVDLPEAPRPDPDVAAPPRFLPEYDNVLLSHADRSRVLDSEDRQRLAQPNGMLAAVLIDGRVGGSWKLIRSGRVARLRVVLYRRLSPGVVDALRDEGARLVSFLAGTTADRNMDLEMP